MRVGTTTVFVVIISSWLAREASAEITTFMEAWQLLPLVEITQGRNQDCGGNRTVYNSSMAKGYRQTWPGTGSLGEDICWRRTGDPFNPNSGLSPWTRCTSDGDCEIR